MASTSLKLSKLCRNCGKDTHYFCKEVFSDDKRAEIDDNVSILLEKRKLLKKQIKEERIGVKEEMQEVSNVPAVPSLCNICGLASCPADCPKHGPLPPPLCKNCAEFGHSKCSIAFNEIERSQLSNLYKQRKVDRDMQMRERFKDYDRRRMAFKRKQPEEQEKERTYQLSKAYRDSRERTEKMKKERCPILKELLTRVADQKHL